MKTEHTGDITDYTIPELPIGVEWAAACDQFGMSEVARAICDLRGYRTAGCGGNLGGDHASYSVVGLTGEPFEVRATAKECPVPDDWTQPEWSRKRNADPATSWEASRVSWYDAQYERTNLLAFIRLREHPLLQPVPELALVYAHCTAVQQHRDAQRFAYAIRELTEQVTAAIARKASDEKAVADLAVIRKLIGTEDES